MNEALSEGVANRIDLRARAIVDEQVRLRRLADRSMANLVVQLKLMFSEFEKKTPGTTILGFQTFRDWAKEVLAPLNLSERSIFYRLSIGRHLLGRISEMELETLGLEKAKSLARLVKAKGTLPEGAVEHAKEISAKALREEVDVSLFRGNPKHDGGPLETLVLVDAHDIIQSIRDKIKRLRPAVTEDGAELPPTDAQVVDFALGDALAGVNEAEERELQRLRGGND